MIAPATSLMMRKSAALPEARFASEEPPKLVGALLGVGTGPGTGDGFGVEAGPGIGAGAAPGAGVVLAGAWICAPQAPQNLASSASWDPHLGQNIVSPLSVSGGRCTHDVSHPAAWLHIHTSHYAANRDSGLGHSWKESRSMSCMRIPQRVPYNSARRNVRYGCGGYARASVQGEELAWRRSATCSMTSSISPRA